MKKTIVKMKAPVNSELKSLLKRMDNLPSIPASIAQIIQTLDDPDSSARDLGRVISLDQSVTAMLLKLVNSPYYGFPRRIDTLDQAVTVLGYRAIRELILITTLFEELGKGEKGKSVFNRELFWRHAVGCGVASRTIAQKIKAGLGETVFLAGLIHDIGKVVLDSFLHDEYKQVVTLAKEENLLLVEAEEKYLGAKHTDFGFWLFEKWNLPSSLTTAVAYHHEPTMAQDHYQLTCVVHMGDILARALELGSGGDDLIPAINRRAWASLSLTPKLMEQIIVEVLTESQNLPPFL